MNILYPQIIASIIIIKPSNNPIQKIILNLKKKFREMNFAKFPFRIVKCANNNFSTGRFKGRISNSLGAQFRQITEKETAARLPLQQWCPRIGGKKLNVPYRRHATLLKLLATAVHGPAVPAVTMKLCTQWGDTTRGGRERCVERRD